MEQIKEQVMDQLMDQICECLLVIAAGWPVIMIVAGGHWAKPMQFKTVAHFKQNFSHAIQVQVVGYF